MQEAVIVSGARTPVGKFQGSLSPFSAPELGGIAIRAAVERAGIDAAQIEEVIMGCVIQAGLGQNPARQAALKAGCDNTVGALTILRGTLTINGRGISIARNLTITGGGLVMDVDDEVSVGGNATFNGASSTTLMTGGELTIAGNLTQLADLSPASFSPSGSHITLFTSGAHTISFATPGSPSGSGRGSP